MRILQVSSPVQLGGGETHVIELTEALRKRGHTVLLAGRKNSAVKPTIHLPFRNSLDIFTVLRLRRILKRESFDIIHAHVARDYPLVAAAARGLPGKVIFTRHLLYPVRAHFLYRRVDGWIAPTRQVAGTLDALKPRFSAIIPNWVNLEKFPFRPQLVLHNPINLGVLGQISPHKGHEDAIDALKKLGLGYRLIIGGKGEKRYVAKLQEKARGLAVEFAGFVSLPNFFEAIDVLLVPSWEEPFGIVLLEAMASGIPVIATSTGGPLDIIRSDLDGILVPPKNPLALADAVRSIERTRGRIVQSARQRVEQEFNIRYLIPKIETFYRTV